MEGTGGQTLTLRSLTFQSGQTSNYGGGAELAKGAKVDLVLCVFNNCRSTNSKFGGGAIFLHWSATIVNLYSTRFARNTADSGNGNDIYRSGGTIIIHNTCPSPYSSNTPTQGKTRMIRRSIASSILPTITPKTHFISPQSPLPSPLSRKAPPSTLMAPSPALPTPTTATTPVPPESTTPRLEILPPRAKTALLGSTARPLER